MSIRRFKHVSMKSKDQVLLILLIYYIWIYIIMDNKWIVD